MLSAPCGYLPDGLGRGSSSLQADLQCQAWKPEWTSDGAHSRSGSTHTGSEESGERANTEIQKTGEWIRLYIGAFEAGKRSVSSLRALNFGQVCRAVGSRSSVVERICASTERRVQAECILSLDLRSPHNWQTMQWKRLRADLVGWICRPVCRLFRLHIRTKANFKAKSTNSGQHGHLVTKMPFVWSWHEVRMWHCALWAHPTWAHLMSFNNRAA